MCLMILPNFFFFFYIPEAFPAVTVPVPSFRKQGLSLVKLSTVVSGLGNSSLSMISSPITTIVIF